MKRLLAAALLAVAALTFSAQSATYRAGQLLTTGTSLPGTCTVGALFLQTSGTIGLNLCRATDTWSLASGAGPSSKASWTAQTTTVRTVKGTAGTVTGYYIYNPNSAVAYVQFFDVASGTSVTLGTTVPDITLGIPATAGANLLGDGLTFTNGIKFACTTTATGNTAPSTGLDVNVYYQ